MTEIEQLKLENQELVASSVKEIGKLLSDKDIYGEDGYVLMTEKHHKSLTQLQSAGDELARIVERPGSGTPGQRLSNSMTTSRKSAALNRRSPASGCYAAPPEYFVIGKFPQKQYLCSCWGNKQNAEKHKAECQTAHPDVKFRIEKHPKGWGLFKNWITVTTKRHNKG
jgi:hypothetical protein